ncbi:MAG: BLUF domain-containing protein [Pseudomonadota bacterium]
MECSLLYVSRSTIGREVLALEIADIIAVSREHNARAGITGGLVRAGGYFAQLLEGSTEAVKALMERIDRDPRHTDVSVVRIAARSKRKLADWSLAYAGESTYVANQIVPLLGPGLAAEPQRIDRLETLIVSFASM